MTVEGTNGAARAGAVIYEFKRAAAGSKQVHSETAGGDAATITDRARQAGKVGLLVEKSADVRLDRIRELKAAIAAGAYRADDREVARRLLARGL